MFRLLKLCAYGLLGYAIYEFVRGMTQTAQSGGSSSGQSSGQRSSSGGSRRPENMTGPEGAGRRVETQDADGGIGVHRVGRGVVHR